MNKELKLGLIVAAITYVMIYLYNNNSLPGTTSTA
jgi:hypothetical protein